MYKHMFCVEMKRTLGGLLNCLFALYNLVYRFRTHVFYVGLCVVPILCSQKECLIFDQHVCNKYECTTILYGTSSVQFKMQENACTIYQFFVTVFFSVPMHP